MGRLQDKICNALTFVGLAGVIGFGTASMFPDSSCNLTDAEEENSTTEETDEILTDTLKEVFTAEETKRENHEEHVADTVPAHNATDTVSPDRHLHDEDETHKLEHTPAAAPAEHNKPQTADSVAKGQ